jgi:hypothetical protein
MHRSSGRARLSCRTQKSTTTKYVESTDRVFQTPSQRASHSQLSIKRPHHGVIVRLEVPIEVAFNGDSRTSLLPVAACYIEDIVDLDQAET